MLRVGSALVGIIGDFMNWREDIAIEIYEPDLLKLTCITDSHFLFVIILQTGEWYEF